MGVRGAAVRDDGGPPSVPGRGRGGPLQQHRQHGGQVGRSSGGGGRLRSAVRTVQVSPDMEQGGQGYLQRGMSYYLYLVRRTATRNRTTIRKVLQLHSYIEIRREVVASY